MRSSKFPGGPTKDEVMAVALFKLGVHTGDLMLDIGCGTGKIAIAAARLGADVVAIDRQPEAIRFAKKEAKREDIQNIDFSCTEAMEFLLNNDRIYDCVFVGGSHGLSEFLPMLPECVRRVIVVNAVLVGTLQIAVSKMQELGIFLGAVHVQVARSHGIAGSIMFKPIDPVYVIVGKGSAC
jgi:cobalt-precorrin-6B (C15)-methyltransferase